MTEARLLAGGKADARESEVPFGLSELDLAPPHLRPGLVVRHHLVERLITTEADVITVTAPAGYGKTTMLAQWADVEETPLAWVNLRRSDNDVRNLLFHIAVAFSRIGVLQNKDVAAFRFAGNTEIINDGPARLARTLRLRETPSSLVLDHAEVLRSRASTDAVSELTHQLEGSSRIVIATRSKSRVPAAVLRSRGRLLELTEEDLAMSTGEVRELVNHLGLEPDAHAESIAATSSGWPVAAYLIGLAIRAGASETDLPRVEVDDRYLMDYVSDEILGRLSASRYRFLKQVAPLERLSGDLCDAVTGSDGSSRSLIDLVESTRLIYPLDRNNKWFAVNRIVREALYAESVRDDAKTVRLTHARAAAWLEANDLPTQAIHHAQEAGDVEAFARLMIKLTRVRYASGNAPSVLSWMDWFESETPLQRYPEVAALGSLVHALEGNGLDAERWIAAAEGPVGKRTPPVVLLVRALGTRDGVPQMIEAARAARAALPPGSEWMPASLLTEGLAHIWMDHVAEADPLFAEAASLGVGIQAVLTSSLALGERALIAINRRDWALASDLSRRSMRLIDDHGLGSYVTSGIGLVAAARCARHRNEIGEAKALLASSAPVRAHLSSTLPGLAVQTLLELATAHIELSDVVGARVLIGEASEIVTQRSDLGALTGRLAEIKESIKGLGPGTIGPSSLTKSELRLLPLLATHLTFRGIL